MRIEAPCSLLLGASTGVQKKEKGLELFEIGLLRLRCVSNLSLPARMGENPEKKRQVTLR